MFYNYLIVYQMSQYFIFLNGLKFFLTISNLSQNSQFLDHRVNIEKTGNYMLL